MISPRRPDRCLPALGVAFARLVTVFALPGWVFRALTATRRAPFAADRVIPDLRPQHSYVELTYELAG